MSQYPYQQSKPWELGYAADDRHVFNFFNAVYAWMAVGLAVTASTAYAVSTNVVLTKGMNSMAVPLLLGLAVLSWFISSQATRVGPAIATVLFLIYSAAIGGVFSFVFHVYSLATLGSAFAVTAGTFGAMSLYGYITKRDLSGMGGILIMAAIGLFIGSIVNVFVASNAFSWLITYAVVIVFTLLTAYDTQRLKQIAIATAGDQRAAASYAIVGSLTLYVNFLNIFLSILRIMGSRR